MFNFLKYVFCSFFITFIAYGYEPLSLDFNKVTLVIAQPSNNLESKFGHAFLRLSKNDTYDSLADTAVEFGADLAGESINYLKGIGLWSSYPFDIKPSPYQNLYIANVQIQERDLFHYELNLSPEQIRKLIISLNEYIVHNKQATYNFLFRNCSSQIMEVLDSVSTEKVSGLSRNIPAWLPEKLKEMGLVKSELTVKSNKSVRAEIIKKTFEKTFKEIDHTFVQNLRSQLEGEMQDRMVAYLKIVELSKIYPNNGNALLDFIKRLTPSEHANIKLDVLRLANKKFEGMYQVYALKSESPSDEFTAEYRAALSSKKIKTQFVKDDGKAKLKVTLEYNCVKPTNCSIAHFYFNHEKLGVSENGEFLELNGHPVSYSGIHRSFEKSIEAKMLIKLELIVLNGKKMLMPIVVQEFPNNDKSSFKGPSLMNESDTKNPFGMCYGVAKIQKMLMENVFFRPNEPKKSSQYYMEVINNAINGKQTFAYGVSNSEELVKQVDQKVLRAIVSSVQTQEANFFAASVEWFKTKKLTKESIPDLQYMIKQGFYPRLTFIPFAEYKQLGHVFIIYDIKDLGDKYQFFYFDPNLGFVRNDYQMWIDKKDMSMSSTFYKKMPKGFVPTIL